MRPIRIAGLALAVLALSGCGNSSSHSTTPARSTPTMVDTVLTAAATKTRHAGSAHVTMTMEMSTAQGTVDIHASGVSSLRAGHAAAAMHLHASLPVTGQSFTIEERMLGTVLYMRSPVLTGSMPGGKPWIKMDLQSVGKQQGVDFSALMSSSNSDPTQSLSYLEASSNTIVKMGTETIDGVQTTHYHAVVDMKKVEKMMVARAPAAQRKALQSTYRHVMAQSGLVTYPMDVWVGSDGLVRQMQISMPMPQLGGQMKMTMHLSRFGAPVHVSAPPASQVTDLSALAGAAG